MVSGADGSSMELLKTVTGKVVGGAVALGVIAAAITWWQMDPTTRERILTGTGRILMWLGIVLVGIYLVILPVILRATVFKRMYENMGLIRYVLMVMHLLLMAMMPIKMVLRWLFNLKYFIYLPEFNANL